MAILEVGLHVAAIRAVLRPGFCARHVVAQREGERPALRQAPSQGGIRHRRRTLMGSLRIEVARVVDHGIQVKPLVGEIEVATHTPGITAKGHVRNDASLEEGRDIDIAIVPQVDPSRQGETPRLGMTQVVVGAVIDIALHKADRQDAILDIGVGDAGLQIDRLAVPGEREDRSVTHLRQQVGIALGDVEAIGRGVQRIQGTQLG